MSGNDTTTYPLEHGDEKHTVENDAGSVRNDDPAKLAAEQEWSVVPALEREIVSKIDRRLLPILGLCYAISLIDRSNISVARLAGMATSLKLTVGERYSIITLVFFIPYILLELPSNILLQRVGARYWLSGIVLAFGVITIGMAFVKTWEELAVCRVLLGVFEAGFFPACAFLISCWYTRYETASRMALFYLTSMVLSGVSNILGYAFSLLSGREGLLGWQWVFLLFGIITVVLAIAAFFLVVDFPAKSTFLTEEEKAIVIARINRDRGDAIADKLSFGGALRHLADPKLWAFAFLFMSSTTGSYAFAYFLPVILQLGLGYSVKLALTLAAPPYVLAAIWTLFVSILSDKTRRRAPFIALNATVCFVGLMITAYAKPGGVRYFGMFISLSGCQANVPATMTYAQNNVLQHSKRSVTSALVIGFGGIGGVLASTVYRQADAPAYLPGLWVTAALQLASIVLLVPMSLYFAKKNREVDNGTTVLEGRPGFKYSI